MDLYSPENLRQFDITLGWLRQWALSRSFGLGTRLPWDKEFLVESLSDSTIYMAYYTIAHVLQEGDMFGKGDHLIKAEDVTDAVFDHIFLDKPCPETCNVPKEKLHLMRREFNFWYPFDLRVSGKDLIQNHLTFTVYNHTAIFPKKLWPRSFRCNGHLMLNNEKMSKSTGNFKTLKQAIEEYSADAMRISLADAGDGLDDANFVEATANASILRLTKELQWIEEHLAPGAGLREGTADTFPDRVFAAEIEMAIQTTIMHYEALNFREALKYGWYDLQTARDTYRLVCGGDKGMHLGLVQRFVEVQCLLMGPITPHTCEHIWANLLNKTGPLVRARMPVAVVTPEHANLQMAGKYLQDLISDLRKMVAKVEQPKKPKKGETALPVAKVTGATMYVKETFTGWHRLCLSVLSSCFDSKTREFASDVDRQVLDALAQDPEAAASCEGGEKMLKKFAMPFVQFKKAEAVSVGAHVLQERLPFDELATLLENADFVRQQLNLETFTACLTTAPEAANAPEGTKVSDALPGKPAPGFTSAPPPAQ